MISLRGPKLKYFASVLALICLALGIYFTFIQSAGFVKTTAVIVDVQEEQSDDDTTYIATVEYTVDGKTYRSVLDLSDPGYEVGKTVTIYYDPDDPQVIHNGRGFGVYLIVVSLAILAIAVLSTIREKKSQRKTEELREAAGYTGYAPSSRGEERELYFLTDVGTPKFGHRIEDSDRRVLYEAKMTKFDLIQPFEFDFIDHEHGRTVPHLVGHTEDSDWGTLLIDNHSTFELDGVDVWKHLKENGISVESGLDSGKGRLIGAKYRILRDGEEIARAETTSRYPHEEDAEKHKAHVLPIQGFFRIWTREEDLGLLFITMMAFARTEATDAEGGNYRTILGTIKDLSE